MELDKTVAGEFRRHGLAGWLLRMWNSRVTLRDGRARRMQLMETLPMGGKRQLMLVRCGDEHFLVGSGVESITTIVKVAVGSGRSEDERCA